MKNELMLFESKGAVVVSSRIVAERFEKRHDNVMSAIKTVIEFINTINSDIENGFNALKIKAVKDYFIESYYIDAKGETRPEFLLTRKGFSKVAMGFTGEKADIWQFAYIDAFDAMESALRERQSTDWLKTREKGKLIRREETDAIQQLIPYAEAQGSKNALMFYTNYSKLVNKVVGVESGQREFLKHKDLMLIAIIEDMITRTIFEEMERGIYYKNIYHICKDKAMQFAKLTYIRAG